MEFKALIWVLKKSYDVILTGKENVFLFIGTLPLRVGCDMACMEFTNVKDMAYYLMSPVGQASYAYLDSCLEDASYDNYDSSFSVDGDAISLCDHDTSDVCSSVSSPPCVEGRGNVCILDFDHMDGPVESICGRPMVDMDSMPVFDVYDDDEGVAPIGDMLMSDMPIWDVESSQEEEPYVDMDAFMAMNAAKAEEICVMESECEEIESSMWEAMDASNASTHVSQDLKKVADVDDWLPGASPMCVWLPMDGPIVVDTDSSCDDASSYDMVDDMHACNHGMVNTLFFSEAEGDGSNKDETNGQQILDVSGSEVLPSEVDSGIEFGHVCADMVSWSEADSESKQKGQSNGFMSAPALEAKVKVAAEHECSSRLRGLANYVRSFWGLKFARPSWHAILDTCLKWGDAREEEGRHLQSFPSHKTWVDDGLTSQRNRAEGLGLRILEAA
ncbi:hypothetical protein L7F22_056028 [Adiantum nelumboides]|nr:hypothetical protein [Adiantum nelumboides]